LPLAFFGTGRRIPHDIEAASPARVAAWLTAA
jgi:flagellar biosynthesis GTPase FlhF